MTDDLATIFAAQVDRVRSSGWLGRSHSLTRLFDFLAEAQNSDRPVREADIAQEVFGRDSDLAGDASVRVYIHRLRKKLTSFYAGPGAGETHRLTIPLGDYRLVLDSADAAPVAAVKPRRRRWPLGAGVAALLLLNLAGWAWIGLRAAPDADLRRAVRGPVWSMIRGDRPVIIVVGDYYIFGEMKDGQVARMVREFDVNSAEDLQTKLMDDPELQARYVDLDTHYTATGSTQALQYIVPAVRAAVRDPRRVQIVASSDLTPEMLKTADVVYVGYLSALRVLEQPVFANSRLKIGAGYDDLIDRKTGRAYDSNAGLAGPQAANLDYGYLRAFEGPSGNHIIIVAGARDIGVVQMAETSVEPSFAAGLVASDKSVEVLYAVRGIGRTNISARRVDLDANQP